MTPAADHHLTGVLLVNLGTPDSPEPAAVRRYLRQFLSDPRVIDIPAVPRWLLLNLVILPLRPKQSAHAYAKIWTPQGSPLRLHGEALARGVAAGLGPSFLVELGMRYGEPSIEGAMDRLQRRGAARLIVLPLFPHAASSSSGSAIEEVYRVASARWNVPAIAVVPPFFADEGFLAAEETVLRDGIAAARADHVLFSFHGLPERHLQKADTEGHGCLKSDACCAALVDANRDCYRAQCLDTARRLASRLALQQDGWSVSFQSRLGRTPWIRPYTDHVLAELPKQGVRRVAVACTGFVADCLETLEEIGLRARDTFRQHGGEDLVLIPSLNDHPAWVRAATELVRRAAG